MVTILGLPLRRVICLRGYYALRGFCYTPAWAVRGGCGTRGAGGGRGERGGSSYRSRLSYNAVQESTHESECWLVTGHGFFGGDQFTVEQNAPHLVENFHNPGKQGVPAAAELISAALERERAQSFIVEREVANPRRRGLDVQPAQHILLRYG